MSLINEALKKAQQRQQGGTVPPKGQPLPTGSSSVPPAQRVSPKTVAVVFAASFLLLVAIGLVGWQAWRMFTAEPADRVAVVEKENAEADRVRETTEDNSRTETADNNGEGLESSEQASNDTDREEDFEPERDPEVREYLRSASISAREAGERSRIIINGRIYGVGETVHFGNSLRILRVEDGTVHFRDRQGAEYQHRL